MAGYAFAAMVFKGPKKLPYGYFNNIIISWKTDYKFCQLSVVIVILSVYIPHHPQSLVIDSPWVAMIGRRGRSIISGEKSVFSSDTL